MLIEGTRILMAARPVPPIRGSRTTVLFLFRSALLFALSLMATLGSRAQTSVLTQRYDNGRTGQNLNETILTAANVNSTTFGKLFAQPVDGQIYAQPLYVPSLAIPGQGTHNVVFVATENDSVYAFDADNNFSGNANPLWHANLIDAAHGAAAGATPMPASDIGCSDLVPIIGITATPVIDLTSGTMYVIAKSKENGGYVNRLHAIDITTGNEKTPGPVVISATVSGTGDGSSNGQLPFDPLHHLARPGLLLSNGTVYIAFASHCDISPYHGWLFAYNAATFAQQAVLNTTPNGGLGGIWMSGAGIAADASGNLFVPTGNGTFDTTNIPATDLGETIMKLSLSNGQLNLLDYFTPGDQANLTAADSDLASGGVMLLPDQPGAHTHVLVADGKEGRIFEVDRDMMTINNQHYCPGCSDDTNISVEESAGGFTGNAFATAGYWNGTVYINGISNPMLAIPVVNGILQFSNASSTSQSFSFPGVSPVISANGTTNEIVWALDDSGGVTGAVLHAYNATNLNSELYNTSQAQSPANRDQAGSSVKFAVPTVVNGKVYVGTAPEMDVYGLLGPTPSTPTITPNGGAITSTQQISITDVTNGAAIFFTTNGTTPTATPSEQYTGPFSISSSSTVEAIAALNGTTSPVTTAAFTILTPAATPSISPNGGAITSSQSITIADTTSGASIFYTTDGTTPLPGVGSTKQYAGAFTLASSATVNAIAVATGFSNSAVASAAFTILIPSTSAATISVDFVGLSTTPMASTEVAGVIPVSNWNDASGATSSAPLALIDQNGNITTAAITWTSDNIWDQSITDTAGNARMMKGYLDNGQEHTSVITVSGLLSNPNGYIVYVYAQGSSNNSSNTGIYQISGTGITTTSETLTYNSNFTGTFTQATPSNPVGNYVVLTIPNVSGFTLSAIPSTSSNGNLRAAVNGIQIVPIQGPNFSLSATPGTVTVNPGGSATYTVSAAALSGFTGTVTLSAAGLPTGATASFNPASITPGTNSTLTVTTTSSTPAGSSTFTISGTSGSLVNSTTAVLTVTDFSLSVTPGSATVNPGGSASYTVSASPLDGFTGSITLSAAGLPTGATATFNPISVTPGENSTLTVATSSNTPAASPTLTIIGTSGSLIHSTTVALGITDFSLSIAPSSATANPGGTTSYTVSTTALNGFTGSIVLSLTGLPGGANGSFNPTSVAPGGTSTLALTTTGSTPTGNTTLTITGMSGSLNHSATAVLKITDFSLSITPGSATVNPNGTASYVVSASALNSFNGSISLSAAGLPTGATAAFSPASISPGTTSTVTVTTAGSTPAGDTTFAITGVSSTITHSITTVLSVTDFSLSVTPSSASVSAGGSATYTVNTSALNGFTGTVILSAAGLPAGATPSFNPASITAGSSSSLTVATTGSTPTGGPILAITGTSGSLSHSATVTLNVTSAAPPPPPPASGAISIDFVGLSTTPMASTEVAGVIPVSNWNDANGAVSSAPLSLVDQNGSATTAAVTWASDNVWDQPITDQPGNPRMMKGYLDNGQEHTSTVAVTGLPSSPSGFTVYVYAQGAANSTTVTGVYQISGPGITTTNTTLTYTSNFTGTFTQATANSPVGNYVVLTIPNVTGFTLSAIPSTSSTGNLRAALNGIQIVPVQGPNFTISATPGTVTLNPGGNATYTVSAAAVNGFSGSVTLSAAGLPTGATALFNPPSIAPGTNSTMTVTTTSGTPAGNPTLTITGTSGSLINSTTVALSVVAAAPPPPASAIISIDFVGLSTTPMASTEVAGVVPVSNWNDANGATSSSPVALLDQNGNSTGASVSWTADDVWDQPITDEPGNARMMKGYLDNGQQHTSTVTVTGLPSDPKGFAVYVYAQGSVTDATHQSIYQISGTAITTMTANLTYNSNFTGTFTQATPTSPIGNYVVLTIPNVPSFTLSAIPSTASTGNERAPINAIQIVPQ